MRLFHGNRGKILAGIVAAMLLTLNVMTAALASTDDHQGDGDRNGISVEFSSSLQVGSMNDGHHEPSHAPECFEIFCHFTLPTPHLISQVFFDTHSYDADFKDQWAVMMLSPLYRPPKTTL